MVKENKIKAIYLKLLDGTLKNIPLYSIFDSTTIFGKVQLEKKGGVFSRSNWKNVQCTLNLQTCEIIWQSTDYRDNFREALSL